MSTTSAMSRYAKFLSQFEFAVVSPGNHYPKADQHVTWHGNVGYIDLGRGSLLVARIELSDRGHQDHFDKFTVDIIHRANGKLDSCTFEFGDFLKKDDRCDDRLRDQPDAKFYAWSKNNQLEWYIAKPKSVAAVTQAVNTYLRMWQTPGQ